MRWFGAPCSVLAPEASEPLPRLPQPFGPGAQRQPDVSLAGLAEAVPGRHHDPGLGETTGGERRGRRAARYRHPDVEGARGRVAGEADRAEARDEHVAALA